MALRSYQEEMVDAFYGFDWRPGSAALGVLAVGGGKTWVLAHLLKRIYQDCPSERALVLSHRAELLSQSAEKIHLAAPEIPLGVFSAGLGKKQLRSVTVAGIQSIHRTRVPPVGTVIIDECHLISQNNDSMYQKFLSRLREDNPDLRVVGLTATPYRLSQGSLLDGENPLFSDIVYDVSLRRLIDEGWLVPFVSKVGQSEADLSGVHTRGGEFVAGEAEAVMDTDERVRGAVTEIVDYGAERRSWLIFTAGVKHAEHVCAELRSRGVSAACVFGHTQGRERIFRDFKNGVYKALVNVEVATTGLDIPQIDLIGLLRPTKSPGLLVQISGRGSRPLPGIYDGLPDDADARHEAIARSAKPSCLFLDFTTSIRDLGPLDDVRAPAGKRKGKAGEEREGPVKVCPNCRTCVAPRTMSCPDCGHEWEESPPRHEAKASTAPVMSTEKMPLATLPVLSMNYRRHSKTDKPDSLRVDYSVGGFERVSEWVPIENPKGKGIARLWWRKNVRFPSTPPETVDEALERLWELKQPTSIVVRQEGKFQRVVRAVFEATEPSSPAQRQPQSVCQHTDEDIFY